MEISYEKVLSSESSDSDSFDSSECYFEDFIPKLPAPLFEDKTFSETQAEEEENLVIDHKTRKRLRKISSLHKLNENSWTEITQDIQFSHDITPSKPESILKSSKFSEIFYLFLDDCFWDNLVICTNSYAYENIKKLQLNNSWKKRNLVD